MAAAILLRKDYHGKALRAAAKGSRDADQVRRLRLWGSQIRKRIQLSFPGGACR